MNKSTVKIWEDLHDKMYFENHPLYNTNYFGIPHATDMEDILDKNVLDFGCGYGRDSYLFSMFAKKVICLDVCPKILKKASEKLSKFKNVEYFLEKDLDEIPDNSLDYIYALHVFQHITKDQAKKYVLKFKDKLKKDGKIMIQFYLGSDNYIEEGKEPRIQYQKNEVHELLKYFKTIYTWDLTKFKNDNSLQYNHYYVKTKKVIK